MYPPCAGLVIRTALHNKRLHSHYVVVLRDCLRLVNLDRSVGLSRLSLYCANFLASLFCDNRQARSICRTVFYRRRLYLERRPPNLCLSAVFAFCAWLLALFRYARTLTRGTHAVNSCRITKNNAKALCRVYAGGVLYVLVMGN
jgi:hypothetical protein